MNKVMLYVGIVLGVIIIVATFLPWATVSFLGESLTVTGMQGDGIISLIAGVVYIIMLFLANKKMLWKIIGAVFGFIVALIGLNDLIQLKNSASSTLGELSSMVSVGIGVWLVLICGILATIVIFLIKPDDTAKPPVTPA
jgi:hypothetical protein